MGEPRIKDLYLYVQADLHGGLVPELEPHKEIAFAHNSLVEMVLSLRERVKELEMDHRITGEGGG